MNKPVGKPGAIVPPADVIPFKTRAVEQEADVDFDPEAKSAMEKLLGSMTKDEVVKYVLSQHQYITWVDMLVKHCWVHSGYHDCGRKHMSSDLKFLYDTIIGRNSESE